MLQNIVKCVSSPTITILTAASGTFHDLKCFNHATTYHVVKYCKTFTNYIYNILIISFHFHFFPFLLSYFWLLLLSLSFVHYYFHFPSFLIVCFFFHFLAYRSIFLRPLFSFPVFFSSFKIQVSMSIVCEFV